MREGQAAAGLPAAKSLQWSDFRAERPERYARRAKARAPI